MNSSRVMIAAVSSGSGKTLISCGLLSFLKSRGMKLSSFKCGPDYIDPMFHRRVLGIPGGNLDSFFAGEDEIRRMAAASEAAVIEGVMGIYDGMSGSGTKAASTSCYETAKITETPIILIVNVKGMGRTMLSLIKGILADDEACLIRGIVLNRISPHYYETIKADIGEVLADISAGRGAEVCLLGGIADARDIKLESRHLGLMLPHEIDDINDQIDKARRLIEEYLDTEKILEIMSGAGLPDTASVREPREAAEAEADTADTSDGDARECSIRPVLAVARDEAFCFYYEENLHCLERLGIQIKEFSPLHDSGLPEDADGMLLGGGYPELYTEELCANKRMMEAVRVAVCGGMPSLAECGGFMYLLEGIQDESGRLRPMTGIVPGTAVNTGRLGRFGYVTVTGDGRGAADRTIGNADIEADHVCPDPEPFSTIISGLEVRGHEFHYYDSDNNGTDALAVKPGSGRTWKCMHAGPEHLWGYPHLYYPSCPELIRRLRSVMLRYHDKKGKKHG